MDSQIDSIVKTLPVIPKNPLRLEVIAYLLSQGYSQADIGRKFNISRQAVDQYIDRNMDYLYDLLNYDKILAYKLKANNLRIENSIDDEDIKKAGLVGKRTSVGIGIDKHLTIEGKLGDGFVYESISIKIDDRSIEIQRLKKLLNVGDNDQNMTDITPDNDDVLPPVMGDNDHS